MVIVAAVDRSERAADVISEAQPLGKVFEEPVHVVHVLSTTEFVNMGRTSVEEGEPIDMDNIREVAVETAADAADDLNIPHETVGLVGDAAAEIVNYANGQGARYVVIAGRKRSPTGKAIFGSVSQSVLLNADCPVVSTINPSVD